MPNSNAEKRHCPTRVDGADALIEHVIDVTTCQSRQRRHYHKCPTCAHCNGTALTAPLAKPKGKPAGRVLSALAPATSEPTAAPEPLAAPVTAQRDVV